MFYNAVVDMQDTVQFMLSFSSDEHEKDPWYCPLSFCDVVNEPKVDSGFRFRFRFRFRLIFYATQPQSVFVICRCEPKFFTPIQYHTVVVIP